MIATVPPVKIIMPWRPEASRQAACDWLVAYYGHRFDADAVVLASDGGTGDEPFNKSRAVNRAVVQWPEHVCVIADADVLICDWSLRQAIRLAATHDRLYLPHNSVCRMTKVQSERFLQLPPDYRVSGRLYRKQRTRAAPGGMWVVRGEFFLRYKMDERFRGWGGEDTELLGRIPRIRLSGPLFHLWHAPADRSSLRRNRRLLGRIRRQRRREARSVVPRITHYAGLPMQQHPDVVPALRSLFADYPPRRILEIGTGAGGFAMLLRELCPEVPIRSYDVRTSPHQAMFTTAGIDARTADVFCPQVLGEIAEYVQQPGRSMIFCDGGDKPAELRHMAQLTKPGDLILAHDYACDREYFHRNMLGSHWDWCEITDADWQPLPNLRQLPREELARVAWLVTEVWNACEDVIEVEISLHPNTERQS